MAVTVLAPRSDSARVTLTTSGTFTSSDTYGPFPVDAFRSAEITAAVWTASGTLNIFVQKQLADGVSYGDIAAFPTFNTSGTTSIVTLNFGTITSSGNFRTETDGTLTGGSSGQVLQATMGQLWRIKTTIAGTGATHNFGIFGDFFK